MRRVRSWVGYVIRHFECMRVGARFDREAPKREQTGRGINL